MPDIPPCKAGPIVDWLEGKEERFISIAPMSLNRKTPDTQGTNHSRFPNTKKKVIIFSSYAPPPSLPQRHRISGKGLFP